MVSKDQEQMPMVTQGYLDLASSSRNFMAQMAYLTRLYFVSVLSGYGDPEAVANKLYGLSGRLQERTEPTLGVPISEELASLLSLQSFYIMSLANALAAGNQEEADHYTKILYQNADDLAAHYAKMNPFWDEMQWRTLLYNYINLFIQDAVALSSHEFEKELDIFERMLLAALAMGDYHADGLYQYMTAYFAR
jgi:hypothetical protein